MIKTLLAVSGKDYPTDVEGEKRFMASIKGR